MDDDDVFFWIKILTDRYFHFSGMIEKVIMVGHKFENWHCDK